jgi:Flp pilus assembly protein TadD
MERAMAIDTSQLWVGYNNIAFFIKFEQKDYKGSLEYFDKAIQLNPKFSNAYNNRGFAKLQLNDLKGARIDINKSQELDPTNSYAYRTMALYLLAENKKSQACEQLQKAIKLGYSSDYDDEVDSLIKQHCK